MPKKIKGIKYYGSQQIKKHKAWKAFSEWVRKSRSTCYCCGRRIEWKGAHASHYISGNVCGKTLFLSEINVKASCPACNLFLHGNSPQFALHLQEEYGQDILKKLDQIRLDEKNAGILCRYSEIELEEIYRKYTALSTSQSY